MTSLAAALQLAPAGIRVFPCKQDKTPYTEHGFKDASCGKILITEWWTRWPDALIGTPTGIWFDVLDLDLQHEPARQWLNEHRGRLPVTRTHETRSGGLHLLFQRNDSMRCSAGRIAPGVDTRSIGGYIIWWPAAGFPIPSKAPLAPWPDWLLEYFRPKARPPSEHSGFDAPSLHGLIRTVANAPEGQRNRILYWAACRAGELIRLGKLNETLAIELLSGAAAHCGLDRKEADGTARSGIKRGLSNV